MGTTDPTCEGNRASEMLEQDQNHEPYPLKLIRNGIQRDRKSSPVSGEFTVNTGTWETFCRSKNISRCIDSCTDLLLFEPRALNSWTLHLFSFHRLPFRTSLPSLLLVFIFLFPKSSVIDVLPKRYSADKNFQAIRRWTFPVTNFNIQIFYTGT